MARLPKLSRIVLCVVVFIFVSVCASEQVRCYWCGPLAEQVHRSQRAPSCDGFEQARHETVCDPGYSHCAIVAVAPPYTESRVCVKFYQDECYPLYCNSTKTWRMVCACRGDLCNGPHSARETQAFALLPKFIKTKPRKRNLISHFFSVKTRKQNEENTVFILNKENETIYDIQSDQPNENITLFTPTPKNPDDNIIIVHGTLKNDEKIHATLTKDSEDKIKDDKSATEATKHETAKVDKAVKNETGTSGNSSEIVKDPDNIVNDKHLDNTNKNMSNIEVDKHLDTAHVSKLVNETEMVKQQVEENTNKSLIKSDGDKVENAEVIKPTSAIEPVKENNNNAVSTSTTAVQSSAAPSKLPPAEALQQNVTPTSAMEHTTIGTVEMSTENHVVETTTLPTETNNPNKKNSGTQTVAHVIIVIIASLACYHI